LVVTQTSGEATPNALELSEFAHAALVLHDIGPERIAEAKSRALIERPTLCPRQGGPGLERQDARAGTDSKINMIPVS
jgi:hypothetical protein